MRGILRRSETRPAAAGIKLPCRVKQRRPTADAKEYARVVTVPVLAGEGGFGAFLSCHMVLLWREEALPLAIGLDNLLAHRFLQGRKYNRSDEDFP